MDELRSCPFCGGDVIIAMSDDGSIDGMVWWFVTRGERHSTRCTCRVFMEGEQFAFDAPEEIRQNARKRLAEAWNKRVQLSSSGARSASHGRWCGVWWSGERAFGQCSECHNTGELRTKRNEWGIWDVDMSFCPDCGADMRKVT